MKKNVLLMSLIALFLFGCSTSDDELQIESAIQAEMPNFKQIAEFIKGDEAQTFRKGENNGKGVYFVPFISNAITHYMLVWDVPNTNLVMYLEYPQDGGDRLLIFNGEEMMINWSSQEPRLFMTDYGNGKVKYSNWCDENKTGFFHINGKSTWYPIDLNGDGETDIYGWDLTTLDKNFNMKVKTTLTDSQISDTWVFPVQGECMEATEEVEFSYKSNVSNGVFKESATFN